MGHFREPGYMVFPLRKVSCVYAGNREEPTLTCPGTAMSMFILLEVGSISGLYNDAGHVLRFYGEDTGILD
jgi:hypothetical protein